MWTYVCRILDGQMKILIGFISYMGYLLSNHFKIFIKVSYFASVLYEKKGIIFSVACESSQGYTCCINNSIIFRTRTQF